MIMSDGWSGIEVDRDYIGYAMLGWAASDRDVWEQKLYHSPLDSICLILRSVGSRRRHL